MTDPDTKRGDEVHLIIEKYFIKYDKKELCEFIYELFTLVYCLWNVNVLEEDQKNFLLEKGENWTYFLDCLVFHPERIPEKIKIINIGK